MPTALDFVYLLLLFLLVTVIDGLFFLPKFKAAVAAGVPDARTKAYRRTTIGQWVFSAIVIVAWIVSGRSWTSLGLVPPTDWRLYAGIALLMVTIAFGVRQSRAIRQLAQTTEGVETYRQKLAELEFLLPHKRDEYRGFVRLAITAGVCEELLVRGYLMWALRPYMSVGAAIAFSAIAFGIAHAYQGKKGVVKTAVVGLVMNGIVLLTGWLIPAMVVHAIIDINAGQLGYAVLNHPTPNAA